MKKLLIILSLLLVGLTSTSAIETEVKAEAPEITWSIFNPFSTYYMIKGEVDLWTGIKSFKFTIPDSKYHILEIGGLEPQINFYDRYGAGLTPIMWIDELGPSLTGEFEIDLKAFGLEDAVRIEILIPQTFSATPSGYTTYLQLNDAFEMLYFITDREVYFLRDTSVSYTRLLATVDAPFAPFTITLDLTDIDYHMLYEGAYLSKIILYDDADIALTQLYFTNYVIFDQNIIRIDIPEEYQVDLDYFVIYLYVDEDIPFQAIDFANKNLTIDYNNLDELIVVQYYSLDVLVNTELIFSGDKLPTFEPTPPESFTFFKWFFDNGDTVYSYTGITTDRAINGIVKVSAYFKASVLLDIPDSDDPILDETQSIVVILSAFGMDSTVGYIIFYVSIAFIATVTLLVFKMSNLTISVVNLLILILVTFWNILPLYVTVTGYILYAVAILMSLSTRGGQGYE